MYVSTFDRRDNQGAYPMNISKPLIRLALPAAAHSAVYAGAGGAQMWKEEENGTARVNETRFKEAKSTLENAGPSAGAETVSVGCPFCRTMMNDASKADGGAIQVTDVAEEDEVSGFR
jgi:Fe-S oxidoreductase